MFIIILNFLHLTQRDILSTDAPVSTDDLSLLEQRLTLVWKLKHQSGDCRTSFAVKLFYNTESKNQQTLSHLCRNLITLITFLCESHISLSLIKFFLFCFMFDLCNPNMEGDKLLLRWKALVVQFNDSCELFQLKGLWGDYCLEVNWQQWGCCWFLHKMTDKKEINSFLRGVVDSKSCHLSLKIKNIFTF